MSKLSRRFAGLSLAAALLVPALARAGEEKPAGPAFAHAFDWRKLLGTDDWAGVYMGQAKCGWVHGSYRLEKREGREVVVCLAEALLKMQYNNVTMEVRQESRQEFSAETGEFLLLEGRLTAGPVVTASRVVPDESGGLVCTITAGGKAAEKKLPACRYNLESALAAQELAARRDAKAGDKLSVDLVVGETASVMRVECTVKKRSTALFRGVPVEVLEIEEAYYPLPADGSKPPENQPPAARSTIRVDASGRTIEGQILGNFTFRLESEADAKRLDAVSDVMLATAVPLEKPVADPKSARQAVLRLTGLPEASMLPDRRQKFEKAPGGATLVTISSDAVPEKRGALTEGERGKLAEFLAPTAFLQSDAPEIKALAAKVAGGEKDPFRAAALLCDWVHKNVDKVFTPAMSNALDTLKTRQGDCGEHAALFVALCRAAGIPAREAGGLAYTTVEGQGLLGGHAWAEVYVGGSWVAVDPTFGEEVADALHLKIAEGGFGGMEGLLRMGDLIGKLKAEVVSVK